MVKFESERNFTTEPLDILLSFKMLILVSNQIRRD